MLISVRPRGLHTCSSLILNHAFVCACEHVCVHVHTPSHTHPFVYVRLLCACVHVKAREEPCVLPLAFHFLKDRMSCHFVCQASWPMTFLDSSVSAFYLCITGVLGLHTRVTMDSCDFKRSELNLGVYTIGALFSDHLPNPLF